MKQLVWTPSSINFGSKKKGDIATAESTLSITEGSALLTPGKISPLPGADYPVQLKNTEGSLHIHPAFNFAAERYYLTSAGAITTDRDTAEVYLGNAGAGSGLPFLPVPITLAITTAPGTFDPSAVLTINYTSSAILWVKVFFKINDSEWFIYNIYNATGTFDMDFSGLLFNHGDILTIKVQDDQSTSFYDTVDFTAIVKSVEITSLNGGADLNLIGEFIDGTRYMADADDLIVESTDPDAVSFQVGYGNAYDDLDLALEAVSIEMVIGDLTITNVPDTMALDTPVTVLWSADTLELVDIYADDVLVGDGIDATLGTYDITLLSTDFSVGDTPVISFREVSGFVFDSEEIEII